MTERNTAVGAAGSEAGASKAMTALTDLLIRLSIWAAVGAAGWWGWDALHAI